MKHTFLIILIFKISSLCIAQTAILIDSNYENSFKKPIVAQRNILYKFETDSIFLVNNQRMIMYETVINHYLNDSIDNVAFGMARFFDQSLRQLSIEYDKLHRNANETQHVSENFIDSTRQVINKSIVALDNAQVKLLDSHKYLDGAIYEIKKQRNRSWLIAVAAIATGIGIDRIFIK